MKLKEYRSHTIYMGIMLNQYVVTSSRKRAAEIMNTPISYLTGYGNILSEPVTRFAIANPEKHIVSFDRSGEAPYFLSPDLIDRPMEYDLAVELIKSHRKHCPTYQATVEAFETHGNSLLK